MQDAELAKRKKRCYDLVVQLDELEGQQRAHDEHLQKIKRQKTELHTEFENEKRSFVEEWAKAESATNRDAEIDRAERAWNEWVSYAKAHPSEARQAVTEVADNNARPSSDSAAAAATTDSNEEGIPVPLLQERVQAAEPPRLRSTRRSRRSFSLTSPTAPSTPVRKKLEWDENAAHNEGSDASELMPSPGGPPSSASSSPASTTTAGGAADSSAAPVLCKLPTPVRGRSTSPAAASAGASTAAAPSRKELIDELLNPSPSSSSSSSPVPQVVVSAPPSSANSARVLFEE